MKAAPQKPEPPPAITQLQLAELACRLVPHDGETDEQLAQRALGIWLAAGKLLAENGGETKTKSVFTFGEVADQSLLPSTRAKTEVVGTGKGVEGAVGRFFDAVLAGYDPAMAGRLLAADK
ncbi:MAG: hypothetical protein WCJ07_08775, partial [Verrucomicrobiota bacterium]